MGRDPAQPQLDQRLRAGQQQGLCADDTPFYTAGIMYETGPWQMSFMWAGFYNTNGNGVSNITSIATGSNIQTLGISTATGNPFSKNSTAFNGNPNTAVFFGRESIQKWQVGANYALGPGIKLVGGWQYYHAVGPVNSDVGDSWAVMLGMDLSRRAARQY
jgi:outer membrane protein OmpU